MFEHLTCQSIVKLQVPISKCVVSCKKESVNMEINAFSLQEEKQPYRARKKIQGAEKAHSLEPQKVHTTSEFFVCSYSVWSLDCNRCQ